MKRAILFLTVTTLVFTACQKDDAPKKLSKEQIRQKVDSIVTARSRELEKASQTDLKHRLRIEVKVKADSMYNASISREAKKDSVKAIHSSK